MVSGNSVPKHRKHQLVFPPRNNGLTLGFVGNTIVKLSLVCILTLTLSDILVVLA